MMTREQCLLVCAAEECAELAQRLTKAARFGLDESQSGQPYNNRERIDLELHDLMAVLGMLGLATVGGPGSSLIEQKVEKVERYLAYSVECGTVSA